MMMNWLESYPLISVTVQNVCFTKWKELGGKKKKTRNSSDARHQT